MRMWCYVPWRHQIGPQKICVFVILVLKVSKIEIPSVSLFFISFVLLIPFSQKIYYESALLYIVSCSKGKNAEAENDIQEQGHWGRDTEYYDVNLLH